MKCTCGKFYNTCASTSIIMIAYRGARDIVQYSRVHVYVYINRQRKRATIIIKMAREVMNLYIGCGGGGGVWEVWHVLRVPPTTTTPHHHHPPPPPPPGSAAATESTIVPPGTKTFNVSFFVLESNDEQQDSIAASDHFGIVSNYQVYIFAVHY